MRNHEAPWDAFDARAYEQHNYSTVSEEDARITGLFFRHIMEAHPLCAVDVGTGSNLIPILAMIAAGVHRIHAWEFSRSNREWLTTVLEATTLPENWDHVWRSLSVAAALQQPAAIREANATKAMRRRVAVQNGSVFELPAQSWDYATMAFCAESITSDMDEFEYAVRKFVQCVIPGGRFSSAFMLESQGYRVGAVEYPAVAVTAAQVTELFMSICNSFVATPIPIVRPLRLGYSGMLVVQGTR